MPKGWNQRYLINIYCHIRQKKRNKTSYLMVVILNRYPVFRIVQDLFSADHGLSVSALIPMRSTVWLLGQND